MGGDQFNPSPCMKQQRSQIADALREYGVVIDFQSVGGGCISDAGHVRLRRHDGSTQSLFVKNNDSSFLDNFQCEAEGLSALRSADAIVVPEVIDTFESGGRSWLICQWIDQGRQGKGFYEAFARNLAELHRKTAGNQIGWDRDNYLGAARQINSSCDDWPDFVAEHRIGFQIRWADEQGLADPSLQSDCEQIVRRMHELLDGRDGSSSLLHGDLWSGNYLCDQDGRPVIIDPAVYCGCREAEFGMIRLFGSCPGAFYDAYQDAWPMPDGWQRRVSVYVLYHLLNHLNLFGTGYLGQCRQMAAEILRS